MLLPRVLAGLGWTVLLPNPRGSTGYGIAFQKAVVGNWAEGDAQDIITAVRSLTASGDGSSTHRAAVMGWSYGGYLAAWLVATTDEFTTAVIGAPMADLLEMERTTDIPEYCHHELAAHPVGRGSLYRDRSPVHNMLPGRPPVLLLHATQDRRCPVDQSRRLLRKLQQNGGGHRLVEVDTHDHLLSSPVHARDRVRRCVEWFIRVEGLD